MNPRTAVIPREQRYWLKDNGEPPATVQTFLAATDAGWPGDTYFTEQKLSIGHGGPVHRRNGYATTMLIRHVALQIVGYVFEDAVMLFNHRPPLRASTGRIWPFVRSFTWPPGPVLRTDATLAFTRHWRRPPLS
jgi:hypothetical protein